MKPSIIYWIYAGLAYILFDNILSVTSSYLIMPEMGDGYMRVPFIDIVTAILAATAIYGLAKKSLLVRYLSLLAIGVQVVSELGFSIYLFIVSKGNIKFDLMFPPFIIFDILLIFLANKIYSSSQLKGPKYDL